MQKEVFSVTQVALSFTNLMNLSIVPTSSSVNWDLGIEVLF